MPVRSRQGLTRCVACRAHIRAADRPSTTVCPFCGARLSDAPTARALTGRGGAIVGSLLAFSSAACGAGEPKPEPTEPPTAGPTDDPAANPNDPAPPFQAPPDDPAMVEAYGTPPPDDDPPIEQSDDDAPRPAYGLAPQNRPPPDRFDDRPEDPPDEPMYGVAP